MDFVSYLEKSAKKIDEELSNILADFLKETKKTNIKLMPFAQGLINSCQGGKKVRGVLVKLGYEMTQSVILNEMKDLSRMRVPNESGDSSLIVQNDNSHILRVSAAFEILHAGFLIHDDIQDKSPIRRGEPSLYQALGGDHYGISQAINIGDISLFLPIKIIADSNFSDQVKIKAISYFSQMVINTGWGQIMDVELGERGKRKGESEKVQKEFINLYKTAKYTIAGPLQLGAILGGLGPTSLKLRGIKEFGENLGIAFQIKDDILDNEVKSVESAMVQALAYADKAKKIIPDITKDEKLSKLLIDMTDYMVERNK